MDNDLISLGLSLSFDDSSLSQLDKISKKVEEIQRQFERLGSPNKTSTGIKQTEQAIKQVDVQMQQLAQTIQKVDLSKSFLGFGEVTRHTQDISKLGDEWRRITQIIKTSDGETIKLVGDLQIAGEGVGTFIQKSQKLVGGMQDLKRATISWGEAINIAFTRLIQWQIATEAIFGTLRLLKQGFRDMLSMETESANIMKVLLGTPGQQKAQVGVLNQGAIMLAKQYGQSVIDVQKSMAVWARQYKDTNDIINMTNASLLAATATDITFEGSVRALSAIMAEWNMETKQAIHVVDVLNEMSNNYRVTSEGLAEALAKTGAGARAAGLSFEELSGILTTSIQSLGLEGGEAGTFWSRVMARMVGNKEAKEAIEALGIETMQPLSNIMDELMIKWENMSAAQKRSFAVTVAGTHHWNKFLGVMDNYNTVIEATAKSYFNLNSAQNEVQLMMSTTQKQIGQMTASWQEFLTQNMAVLGATKALVNTLTSMINGANQVPPAILGIASALTVLIPAVVALDRAVKALMAKDSLAYLPALLKIILSPVGLLIAALAALGTWLYIVGQKSQKAAENLNVLKVQVQQTAQAMQGDINRAEGIDRLTGQYNKLREAIAKAREKGEDYHGLQVKLNIVTDKLIQGIANGNIELANRLKKYDDLNDASKQELQNIVNEINANRRKESMQLAMIADVQSAKLTAHLTNITMLDDEYRAFMRYEKLKYEATKNPGKAFKYGWEKAGGWESPLPALISGIGSALSKGKWAFGNPLLDWFGLDNPSRFDNVPYVRELSSRIVKMRQMAIDAANTFQPLSLEEILGYNKDLDLDNVDGGSDIEKQTVNFVRYTNTQIAAIEKLAKTIDDKFGDKLGKKTTITFAVTDEFGNIISTKDINATVSAVSQAQSVVDSWSSSIKSFVSAAASAIRSTDSIINAFKKFRPDEFENIQRDFSKKLYNLARPKRDIEQQFEQFFSDITNIYADTIAKTNREVEERARAIKDANDKIAEYQNVLGAVNNIRSILAKGGVLDDQTTKEISAMLSSVGLEYTSFTSETLNAIEQEIKNKIKEMQIGIDNTRSQMEQGKNYSNRMSSALTQVDSTTKQLWEQAGVAIQVAMDKVEEAKKRLEEENPAKGSRKELELQQAVYDAQQKAMEVINDQLALFTGLLTMVKDEDAQKGIQALVDKLKELLNLTDRAAKPPRDKYQNKLDEQFKDIFKSFIKGTKSALDAIIDYLTQKQNDSIDAFVDSFVDKLSGIASIDGSFFTKLRAGFSSLISSWKEMTSEQQSDILLGGLGAIMGSNGANQKAIRNMQIGGAIGGIFGPIGSLVGGLIGSLFGSNPKPSSTVKSEVGELNKEMKEFFAGGEKWKKNWWSSSKRDLQKTIYDIAELIDVSIDSIAGGLANAFQSATYFDFLQSWGTSLESMTRNALIKAFLAQDSYQNLYKELSNTIVKATVDGVLTGDEIASIRSQGNALSAQMRVLYQSLALVDNMFPDMNQNNNSERTYTAGSSTPIVYNNYVTVQSMAFMGDEDDARTFANFLRDYIVAEEARG